MARQAATKSSTQIKYFPLNGGLDLVTPPLSVDPGFALSMSGFETWYNGGYRRVDGYERFSGQPKPSAAVQTAIIVSSLSGIAVGTTMGTATNTGLPGTGVSSGATAQFIQGVSVGGTSYLAFTNAVGTFTTGERIYIGTTTSTGTTMSAPSVDLAPLGTGQSGYDYDDEFLAGCQNYYRQQINPVPGTGNMLGAWQNGTNIYAVRGTGTAGTPANLWLSSGTGWYKGGTFCSTMYYSGLGITQAQGTGVCSTSGVITISAMATGTFILGMSVSDVTGYIPTTATVTGILSGTGGVGTIQINPAPSMAVAAEQIYGVYPNYTLPPAGGVITGNSGTATVYQTVPLDTSIGYIALLGVTGTFTNGENLVYNSATFAQAASLCTPFTLPSTGFYRWRNYNFFGNSSTYSTYGVNGKGPAFQIDQNNIVMPILMPLVAQTGQPANNTPFLVEEYQNYLALAFPGGNLQLSVLGVPYQFNGFLGAAQFGVGAEITGMHSIVGPGLALMTNRNSQVLSGNTAATFQLNLVAEHAGATEFGSVSLDTVYSLNSLGITSLSRTQSYGNFVGATVSQLIQPMIQSLVGTGAGNFTDATIVRRSNQARIYFNTGDTISMYVPGLGQQNKAWSAIETGVSAQFGHHVYPAPVYNTCNTEDLYGNETSYFGSINGDGYVYQARSGTSWDGAAIASYVKLVFNSVGSPAMRKYFRRMDLEINADEAIMIKVITDLNYSTQENAQDVVDVRGQGGGGYWDTVNWNQFYWDEQSLSTARASIDGTGQNISILIYHQSITDPPFILQGITFHFDARRYQR